MVDLNLKFSEEATKAFYVLKARSGCEKDSDVVKNALRLYEWFLLTKEEGKKILTDDGTTTREVEFIF
jgi:hypothetical protein